MATILDLTAEIVMAHASSNQMTSDELLQEIQKVHATLQALEGGGSPLAEEAEPAITIKQAFKRNEVICMVCGKGMKTLKKHLSMAHDMKPGEYRKQFGIKSEQPLTARSYSVARKKMAEERGLGDVLAKARETRMAKLKGKNAAPLKKAALAKPAKVKAVKSVGGK